MRSRLKSFIRIADLPQNHIILHWTLKAFKTVTKIVNLTQKSPRRSLIHEDLLRVRVVPPAPRLSLWIFADFIVDR